MLPFVRTKNGMTVYISSGPVSFEDTHPMFNKIYSGLVAGELTELELNEINDEQEAIKKWSKGAITFDGTDAFFNGFKLHSSIRRRLIAMVEADEDVSVLEKFLENLFENPSSNSVEQLYGFLTKNNLPITPDGMFFAYKKVRWDMKDIYSGTFDNSVGAKPKMARHQVDDNMHQTCSHGLHVASFDYMQHYGGSNKNADDVIVIVKVNPKDVVSVPTDYNNAKMRVTTYEVVGIVPRGEGDILFKDFSTADTSRISRVIESVREFDAFSGFKFSEDVTDGFTDFDTVKLVSSLFEKHDVKVLGCSSIDEVTANFLKSTFWKVSVENVSKFIVNNSEFGK